MGLGAPNASAWADRKVSSASPLSCASRGGVGAHDIAVEIVGKGFAFHELVDEFGFGFKYDCRTNSSRVLRYK